MDVKTIAVIGAGTMGAGIAQLAATHGCTVFLVDIEKDVATKAVARIATRLDRSVEKGRITATDRTAILDRIHPLPDLDAIGKVELAIEAVVERLDVKQQVFRALEAATGGKAILASNTSSLSITQIAKAVSDPSRVIGMHFFNPAPVMPLVEVIAGDAGDAACLDLAVVTAKAWGKTPVRAADTPGFIVNRVARGFYLEALRLLDEGVGGVDEIDGVMRRHGGFRMGPFELMDLIGLDVSYAASVSVWERMGKPARLTPHEIQRELVSRGQLGRAAGRGFYSYDRAAPIPARLVDRRSFELTPLLTEALFAFSVKAGAPGINSTEQYIFGRILAAIIHEAALAFEQGVAGSDDIDLAMTKGMNYPKGPLVWADEIGHRTVRGVLRTLNERAGDGRYEPASFFG